jgi:hypothetical protein
MFAYARSRTARVAAIAACLGVVAACSNPGAPLGGDCLRSDDCAEGVCVALRCRLAPTDSNARASGGVNAFALPAAPDATPSATEDAGTPSADDAGTSESDAGTTSTDAGTAAADAGE